MKKNILILLFIIGLFLPSSALAVCPVCSVTIVAGIELSRWLRIDDVISGIWIGGLIISLVIWFLSWLNKPRTFYAQSNISLVDSEKVRGKKNIKFKLRQLLVLVLSYLIVIFPLYWAGFIGHSCNQLWGFDKLLIGIFFGSLAFAFSVWIHNFLKKKNNGRVYFSFQKVVIPISFLIIASIIFYFITKC